MSTFLVTENTSADKKPYLMFNNSEPRSILKFVKISERAHAPTKGSPLAAGYDLYSAIDTCIEPHGKGIIRTDLKVAVPHGTYGRVAPRSGLAANNFIDVGAGIVDEDYRGPLGVVLFNHANVPFKVNQGDRIAQFICEKIVYPELLEVEDLDKTERGEGGFGSTGTN
jgi:dUTP pyrophosphatase